MKTYWPHRALEQLVVRLHLGEVVAEEVEHDVGPHALAGRRAWPPGPCGRPGWPGSRAARRSGRGSGRGFRARAGGAARRIPPRYCRCRQ